MVCLLLGWGLLPEKVLLSIVLPNVMGIGLAAKVNFSGGCYGLRVRMYASTGHDLSYCLYN